MIMFRLAGDDSHPQLQVFGMGFATIRAVQVVQSLESSTMAMYDILESLENMPSTSSIYPILSYPIYQTIYLSIYLPIYLSSYLPIFLSIYLSNLSI
jgi:hypothetical protein